MIAPLNRNTHSKRILHCSSKILACFLLSLSLVHISHADHLYTGFIPSDSNTLSNENIKQAFKQVITKVSGNTEIAQTLALDKIQTRTLRSYILSKTYQQNFFANQNYWVLQFNDEKIDRYLHPKQAQIWGQPRPDIYVIIVNKNKKGQWEILEKDHAIVSKTFTQARRQLQINQGVTFTYIEKAHFLPLSEQKNHSSATNTYHAMSFTQLQSLITNRYLAEYLIILTAYEQQEITTITTTDKYITEAIISTYDENPDQRQLIQHANSTLTTELNHSTDNTTTDNTTLIWRSVDYQIYQNAEILDIRFGTEQDNASSLTYNVLKNITDFIYDREIQANTVESSYRLILHNINNISAYDDIITRLQNSRWFKQLKVEGVEEGKIIISLSLKGDGSAYFNYLTYHDPILRNIYPPSSNEETLLIIEDEEEIEGIDNKQETDNGLTTAPTPPTNTQQKLDTQPIELHFEYL